MKTNRNFYSRKSVLLIVMFITLSNALMAQVDTAKVKTDTIKPVQTDTTAVVPVTPVDTTAQMQTSTAPAQETSGGGKSSEFIIYAGINSNTMGGSTANYDSDAGTGYHIGVAWKKSGFVYGQFGIRYNEAVYKFKSKLTSKDTGNLTVQALDIPLTAGINFLSFAKIVSLRAFISAVPTFNIGVKDNKLGIDKDNLNSFIFQGQIGLGANIAFALIDVGYNYGFQSLLENIGSSNPSQFFVSLGVRF